MTGDKIHHGTYGGALAHRRYGERPCDQCRAAQAAYMAQWRANNPDKAKAAAARYRARQAADARAGRALRLARDTGRPQGPG